MAEYGVVLAVIAVIVVTALTALSGGIGGALDRVTGILNPDPRNVGFRSGAPCGVQHAREVSRKRADEGPESGAFFLPANTWSGQVGVAGISVAGRRHSARRSGDPLACFWQALLRFKRISRPVRKQVPHPTIRRPWSAGVASSVKGDGGRAPSRILQFIPGDVPSQPVVEPWAAVDLTQPGLRLGDIVNTAMWWVPRPGKTFNWTARRAS